MTDATEQQGIWINFTAQKLVQVCAGELRKRKLGPVDMMVLLAIVRHFPAGQMQGWVAYPTIADEASCGERTAFNAVKRLLKAGVLKKSGRDRGGENLYQLLLSDGNYRQGLERIALGAGAPDASAPCTSCTQEETTEEIGEETSTERQSVSSAGRSASPIQIRQEITHDNLDDSKSAQSVRQLKPTGKYAGKLPGRRVKSEAAELAEWFFDLIGQPEKERLNAEKEWPGTLAPLLQGRDLQTVKDVIAWAYADSFWEPRLRSKPARYSAEYVLDKFGTWLHQRANEAERAARKPKPQSGVQYQPLTYPSTSNPTRTQKLGGDFDAIGNPA